MTTKTSAIGLIEVTSQTQANNGTQCFHDPQTGCDYISYESGYVRRKLTSRYFSIYQLNKTRKVQRELTWSPGKFVECTERILEMNPDARIDIVVRAAINYRNYLKK